MVAKILFFPAEIGLAHIARSLAVAEACQRRGHDVVVALPKRKISSLPAVKLRIVEVEPMVDQESMAVIEDHFQPGFLERLTQSDRAIIETEKPDLVVFDFRFSALLAATLTKTPVVSIANSTSVMVPHQWPAFSAVEPLRSLSRLFILSVNRRVQQKLITEFGRALSSFSQQFDMAHILQTVFTIVPEHSGYMPTSKPVKHLHYVQSLEWTGFFQSPPRWLGSLQKDHPTVYLSFGGTGFSPTKLLELANALVASEYQVIVSTGSIADPEMFPKHPRLFVEKYLDVEKILSHVDVVVCHGGYGTLSQAARFAKPVVSVPFNPDQMIHGLRFQELGLGKCLFHFDVWSAWNLVRFQWDDFKVVGESVSVKKVVEAVGVVIVKREQFAKQAELQKQNFASDQSAQKAARLLETFLET